MGLHDYHCKSYFHKWVFHFCLVCFILDYAIQMHLFWLPDVLLIQCKHCILLLVLSRGLVIKYLRVITSSRLCGDNPANFAVLHTIAYNCQSSLCLVNFLGPEDLLYYLSLVHPCARLQEFLLLLLSRHPWLPLSPWWPPIPSPRLLLLLGLDSCEWSSRGTCLLQMIIHHPCHPNHPCQDPDSISRTFLEHLFLVHFVGNPILRCIWKIMLIFRNWLWYVLQSEPRVSYTV